MADRTLLIMDDEPEFGAFASKVAEPLGFDVTVIQRSRDFKSTYESLRPDVIVLDIVMPEMDGIELIQWLAENGL